MKQVNEVTGKTEEIFAKPIHSQDAELVRQRLLEYGNIEIIGLGYDNDGRLQHIVPFSEEMTEIVLKKANGDNNGSSAEYCYCDGRDYHLWICRSVITDWSS